MVVRVPMFKLNSKKYISSVYKIKKKEEEETVVTRMGDELRSVLAIKNKT
jgi:hypothetical protein